MVGTEPLTRLSVEAKPALYWPWLLKQSAVKWFAHTIRLTGTVAGARPLKMKRSHCLFCSSAAGTEYRPLCWFLQPATEQFAWRALTDDIAKAAPLGRAPEALFSRRYVTTGGCDKH